MSHVSPLELLAAAVALYVLGITTGLRWSRHLAPRRMDDPNPYGELPPVVPNAKLELAELIAHDWPEPERTIWLAILDPITREPNGGALPVAIRQNANIHARN